MQKLIDQCLTDTPSKRAKLYGMAMLRSIENPRMISQALGIGKDKRGYAQAFHVFYQDYAFVFTDETYQHFQVDIRDFLRQYLLTQRHELSVKELTIRIHENQQQKLHDLEKTHSYQDLRTRLCDEEWAEAFLDLLEATFWVDPSVGVSYAISCLLAASLYNPYLVFEVVDIARFFIDQMGIFERECWSTLCRGFNLLDISLQLQEKIKAVRMIKDKITRLKLPIYSPFISYRQELIAALSWQEGELYRGLHLLDPALQCYKQALPYLFPEEKVAASTARLYWILADKVADFKPQLQIEFLTKVIELQPDFEDAYLTLGNQYFYQGEYQIARTYYQYAVELQPHEGEAWIGLGVIHSGLKEYQRALDELNYAEYLDSTIALLYYSRANVYRELKDYVQAIKDFDQAINLDPSYSEAFTNRGNIYAMLNQPEQASQDYEQAIRLHPNDVQALWMYEWIHFGKQCEAQKVVHRLQEIASVKSDHYLAAVCNGIVLYLNHSPNQALAELERGCKEEPDEWDSYFWLAMVYASLCQLEQAEVSLYKAVELGIPKVLLFPLYWLEEVCPSLFQCIEQRFLQEFSF